MRTGACFGVTIVFERHAQQVETYHKHHQEQHLFPQLQAPRPIHIESREKENTDRRQYASDVLRVMQVERKPLKAGLVRSLENAVLSPVVYPVFPQLAVHQKVDVLARQNQ
jgi:hypothetical protein